MFFGYLPLVKDIYGCDTFVASVVYDLIIAKKTFLAHQRRIDP